MQTHTVVVRLFGSLAFEIDASPPVTPESPRQQALLAYLLLRSGPHPRAYLAQLLWPESEEEQSLSNLRNLLTRLRQAIPALHGCLEISRSSLAWRTDLPVVLDVLEFDRLTRRPFDATALPDVLALYRDTLLPSCYDEWIIPERSERHDRLERYLDAGIAVLEGDRHYTLALTCARRRLELDPLHEPTYVNLMRLYALNDCRADALRTYQLCEETMRRELQVSPSASVQALYAQLLKGQPTQSPLVPLAARLVGRPLEWQRLKAVWQQSASGFCQIVAVSGEAGIGKSRLLEELARWATAQGIAVASARCYELEGQLAFSPAIALLRSRMPRQLEPVWMTELARLLPELASATPSRPPSTVSQGQTPSQPSLSPRPLSATSESWQRQRLLEAMARALLSHQPVLVILDDVHCCDRDTLEWLHFLVRFRPTARLLLAVTLRLEGSARENPAAPLLDALQRDQRVHMIPLTRLDAAATAELVGELLTHSPSPELAARVHRESEGNCLFITEMARAGALTQGLATPSPLPETIGALFQLRLARLSGPARDLVDLAAVIGRACTLDELATISMLEPLAFLEAADELQRRDILRDLSLERVDFSHGKLRQFAYNSQHSAGQRMLHLKVARGLERLCSQAPERYHGEIAAHFEKAGHPGSSIPHALSAGETALRVYAWQEARQSFAQALHCLSRSDSPSMRWQALKGQEEACYELHDAEAQARTLRAMETLANAHPRESWLAEVRIRQSRNAARDGNLVSALALAREAVLLARQTDAHLVEAHASFYVAKVLAIYAVSARASAQILEAELEALSLARRVGADALEAELEAEVATTLSLQGRADEAHAHGQRALVLARAQGDRRLEARALSGQARAFESTRTFSQALEPLRQAVEITQELSLYADECLYRGQLGFCCLRSRLYLESIEHISRAVELARDAGQGVMEYQWLKLLGTVYRELGDTAQAMAHLEQALHITRTQRLVRLTREILGVMARTAVEGGDAELGLRLAWEGLELDASTEQLPLNANYGEPLLRYALGLAFSGQERWPQAVEQLEEAHRRIVDGSTVISILRVWGIQVALAEALLQCDRTSQALALLHPLIAQLEHHAEGLPGPERALYVYSQGLGATGDPVGARYRLEQARALVNEVAQSLAGSRFHQTYLALPIQRRILATVPSHGLLRLPGAISPPPALS